VIALDGNAVAGDLIEILGVDHAAATCVCAQGTPPKKGIQ
jgi:hypothetical protein